MKSALLVVLSLWMALGAFAEEIYISDDTGFAGSKIDTILISPAACSVTDESSNSAYNAGHTFDIDRLTYDRLSGVWVHSSVSKEKFQDRANVSIKSSWGWVKVVFGYSIIIDLGDTKLADMKYDPPAISGGACGYHVITNIEETAKNTYTLIIYGRDSLASEYTYMSFLVHVRDDGSITFDDSDTTWYRVSMPPYRT